jgi:hypothetical protein
VWSDRPAAERSWCLATPTYSKHFTHTIKALEDIHAYAADTVAIFVVATDTSEAASFYELARKSKEMPVFELLNLVRLAKLPLKTLQKIVASSEVEHTCHLGTGSDRQWGHLKKMVALNHLFQRGTCKLIWEFDAESRPMRNFGFREIFSRHGTILVSNTSEVHNVFFRGKPQTAACIQRATNVHGLLLSSRTTDLSLRENDFWFDRSVVLNISSNRLNDSGIFSGYTIRLFFLSLLMMLLVTEIELWLTHFLPGEL